MTPFHALVVTLQELTPEAGRRLKRALSPEQVLMALCMDRGNSIEALAAENWSLDSLTRALAECRSIQELPELVATADFDESIIPKGTERAFYEDEVKRKGEVWLIQEHGTDAFPSNPHGYNPESNLKLDLGNGYLYLGKRPVGFLRRDNFMALRDKVKHVALPPLER